MAVSMENILAIEKSLLRGVWNDQIHGSSIPAVELAKLEVESRFRDVLTSKQAISLFQPASGDIERPFQDIFTTLSRSNGTRSVEDELTRLVVAIACLHAFIQANWTGPVLDIKPLELVSHDNDLQSPWTEEVMHSKAVQELSYGGEPAYHLSEVPAFLRFAQLLVSLPYKHVQSIPWWRLRVTLVHQRVLDEPVILHEDFRASLLPLLTTFATESDLAGRIYLELGLLDHISSQDKLAAEYFIKAAKATGLEYELSGALGKRTKFQASEVPQLVLLAESHLDTDAVAFERDASDEQESSANAISKDVPETLALNDDTLLENTEFTSSMRTGSVSRLCHIDPSSQSPLHPLDQCIVLSLCLNVRNMSPAHGLTTEQMTPYVSRVILHPQNWSIHSMALLLRSRLESSRTRTVERSTLQLQALIDQMPTSDSKTSERLLYFHSILLPSKWEMERELAQRYLSLGIIKSALEILERLERWEDVINCYGSLEKQEKGIMIVRDLLEGRKEEADVVVTQGKLGSAARKTAAVATHQAKLWCLLGDLEPANALDHYKTAWTVSNQTSGRAMRSLGAAYFAQGNYSDAIDCLGKAAKINPLLMKTWFILGCAYMRTENWEEAKTAFGRCVMIDEEDGESWNNLANVYLQVVKKSSAAASNEQSSSFLQVGHHSCVLVPSSDAILWVSREITKLTRKSPFAWMNLRNQPPTRIRSLHFGPSSKVCDIVTKIGGCGITT